MGIFSEAYYAILYLYSKEKKINFSQKESPESFWEDMAIMKSQSESYQTRHHYHLNLTLEKNISRHRNIILTLEWSYVHNVHQIGSKLNIAREEMKYYWEQNCTV